MKITLYTIHCPQCNVLKKKLDIAGISYSIIDDKDWLRENGYTKFPILEIDGKEYNFTEAIGWLKER
jgi:glutaredoxin